jgi:hypothetical protein
MVVQTLLHWYAIQVPPVLWGTLLPPLVLNQKTVEVRELLQYLLITICEKYLN